MQTRIYVVIKRSGERRLVEAGSAAQAIRHCVAQEYTAKAATPKDIANLMAEGRTVERAGQDFSLTSALTASAEQQPTTHTN